jgi:hypothetical protein
MIISKNKLKKNKTNPKKTAIVSITMNKNVKTTLNANRHDINHYYHHHHFISHHRFFGCQSCSN